LPVDVPAPVATVATPVAAPAALNVAPPKPSQPALTATQERIAIISMSGRYPGAKDLDQYWDNLVQGKSSVKIIPKSRWDVAQYYDATPATPGKMNCKWMGYLDDIGHFDPDFFMISAAEACSMDPQHRLFLEQAYKAFEQANYLPSALSQTKCGVYLGIMSNEYSVLASQAQSMAPGAMLTGASASHAVGAARIPYYLNLKGPAIPIDTACSSSLVALHLASQALFSQEIDMALVGGASLYLTPASYVGMSAAGMLSPDGQCKSFDDAANGFVPGEGVGALVLKRLSDAEKDGDPILATIIGSGINQNGKTNGISAPNMNSQVELTRDIYRRYNIDPASISYIEAHGTGTKLGDSIELQALAKVFKEHADLNVELNVELNADLNPHQCALGSGKSNIGHTSAAAGVAGIHKILLSMQHKTLAPSLNYTRANSLFNFDGSPFYVNTEDKAWDTHNRQPRRAAVSSFGFSGTNAHVVIEEYIATETSTSDRKPSASPAMIVLSAKNPQRLKDYAKQLLTCVQKSEKDKIPCALEDLAYTLQLGRDAMVERLGLVVNSMAELAQILRRFIDSEESVPNISQLYLGRVAKKKVAPATFDSHDALLAQWVKGSAFDWQQLYADKKPRWAHAPTYPFAKEYYWLDEQVSAPSPADTISGKKPHTSAAASLTEEAKVEAGEVEEKAEIFLQQLIAKQLNIAADEVDVRLSYYAMGLSSLDLLKMVQLIKNDIDHDFSPTLLFDYTSVEDLAPYLASTYPEAIARLVLPENDGVLDSSTSDSSAQNDTVQANTGIISANAKDRYLPFPLSDIQESFLIGRKIGAVGGGGCHIYMEMTPESNLDIYRLNSAWNTLVQHHDMLRAIMLSNGQQQICDDVQPYKFKVVDLSRKSEADRQASLAKIRDKMSHYVYQVNQSPLFNIRISVCPDQQVIHFSIDELIVDAFSLQLLLTQWWQLYVKGDGGGDWTPPAQKLSFRDYIVATKEYETTPLFEKDVDYWLGKLQNMPAGPRLALRAQFATLPEAQTNKRTRLEGSLASEHWQGLKQRIEALNVSPTVLLLSVFSEILRTGTLEGNQASAPESSFSLILTLFSRVLQPELEPIVGPLISTNIFVAQAFEQGSFSQQVQQTQKQLLEDLGHNRISGIRVLREFKKRGKAASAMSLPVVFTSLLGQHSSSEQDVSLDQAQGEGKGFSDAISYSVTQTPQVYLDHQVQEYQGDLVFTWDVAEDYYAPGLISKLLSDYCWALHMLANHCEQWDEHSWASLLRKNQFFERKAANELAPEVADLRLEFFPEQKFKAFPLTDQQQAYIFGRSNFGGNISSLIYTDISVANLDLDRLESAWQKMLQVHDMLITVILTNGTQKVLEQVPHYPIKINDLRADSLHENSVKEALGAISAAIMATRRPLGQWPFFDLQVSKLDGEKSIIHFSIDLLIADGTSIQILLKDLLGFYQNPTRPAVKHKVSFRDYLLSLNKYESTDSYQRSVEYWSNKFTTISSGPALPELELTDPKLGERAKKTSDKQAPGFEVTELEATQRHEGGLQYWYRLKQKAQQLGVAPSIVLLSVYAEVLAAWADSPSFSIVIPSWERLPLHDDIDQVIGDFTAMSWLAVEPQHCSFAQKVQAYHQAVEDDLSHKAVSGLKALRSVAMKNRGKAMLSFPIVFTNLSSTENLELPEGFEMGKSLSQTSQVHLDNISSEHGGQLSLYWDEGKGRFPEGMVAEMFAAYQRVLEHLEKDDSHWQQSDFAALINAQPARYQGLCLSV
ncbi:MAG: hypothetical protein JKY93_01885, partial [Gammaproteobacteria bacterium]|nr:hypothetical protein [Gammaproteobacteria bacterium]